MRLAIVATGGRSVLLALSAMAMSGVGVALAQDSGASQLDNAAPSAPAEPAHPTPALLVQHAEKGLLLGITSVGDRLIAVGGNGVIVISDDGATWAQVPSPVDIALTAVSFADAQQGWAVGHDAVILHTNDGGKSWKMQNFQPDLNAPLFSILALDAQHAVAVGAFGTVKSTEDGGEHWNDVASDALSSDKLHLNAITKLANGTLFIVGEHGLAAASQDGHEWHRLESPYEGSFFGTEPWGAQGAIAFGLRGNIYATADVHTVKWQKVEANSTSSLFGGAATANGKAVLVGNDGTLVAVNDAGVARKLSIAVQGQGRAGTYTALVGSRGALVMVGDGGVTKFAP